MLTYYFKILQKLVICEYIEITVKLIKFLFNSSNLQLLKVTFKKLQSFWQLDVFFLTFIVLEFINSDHSKSVETLAWERLSNWWNAGYIYKKVFVTLCYICHHVPPTRWYKGYLLDGKSVSCTRDTRSVEALVWEDFSFRWTRELLITTKIAAKR